MKAQFHCPECTWSGIRDVKTRYCPACKATASETVLLALGRRRQVHDPIVTGTIVPLNNDELDYGEQPLTVDDIRHVKQLVTRLGREQFAELVEAVG